MFDSWWLYKQGSPCYCVKHSFFQLWQTLGFIIPTLSHGELHKEKQDIHAELGTDWSFNTNYPCLDNDASSTIQFTGLPLRSVRCPIISLFHSPSWTINISLSILWESWATICNCITAAFPVPTKIFIVNLHSCWQQFLWEFTNQ